MNPKLPTKFAPAERASADDLLRQSQYFASAPPLLRQILDAVPDSLIVLNRERQIVFANQRLLDFLGMPAEAVIGLRPGEAIHCIHAFEFKCGCGATEFCSTCGAAQVILASQQGEASTQECRIMQGPSGAALDLRVRATPLEAEAGQFTIFALTDISHEKRRQALERIFFHDVMNVATVLLCSAHLLQETHPGSPDELTGLIYASTEVLVEEITAQRQLAEAENNELTVQTAPVDAQQLLQEMAQAYRHHAVGNGCQVHVDAGAAGVTLISDPILLRRVLGNMVKNALEACQPDQTVALGCVQREDQVEFWVHNPNPMPRHVQLQIFQRSFSTKGTGRGLGTYSMKLLGERYLKGSVTFSTGKEGTVFKIACPNVLEPSHEKSAVPTYLPVNLG